MRLSKARRLGTRMGQEYIDSRSGWWQVIWVWMPAKTKYQEYDWRPYLNRPGLKCPICGARMIIHFYDYVNRRAKNYHRCGPKCRRVSEWNTCDALYQVEQF